MYWACARDLQPSGLEAVFARIESLLGMSTSPSLMGWVGSEHTANIVERVDTKTPTPTPTLTLIHHHLCLSSYIYCGVHAWHINTENLHYDDEDNLHLMLHGRKRWLVFPPNTCLPYPSLLSLLTTSSSSSSPSAPTIQPDPCTSPLDATTHQPPIDITLSPGDLLYLPTAWSHQVHSLPDTPTSFVFSVNKFYPTSLFTCARRGSAKAVATCKLWNFKLKMEGWV
jgi:hypothetical protein